MANNRIKVGMIGCGNIAPAYVRGCAPFDILDLAACADINPAAAQKIADEYGLQAMSVEELLADPEIQIVINLTIPKVHAEVSLAIIEAGKHVHSEKPLAVTREDGQKILAAAQAKGLKVGCAPDTFLGGGIQTCRRLIDDGVIGDPVAATGFFAAHGPESWHPNPFIFYQTGAGPLFDLGPYYLTALVYLLGPVTHAMGSARISFPERIATSPALNGTRIPVEVPTHVTGSLNFANGAIGTVITSFDVWAHTLPRIEIFGSEGTLSVPDPNRFDGAVRVWTTDTREWEDMPLTHNDQVGRGIGVADMAYAIRSGRPHRANGQLAYHVLDLMHALIESSEQGTRVAIGSTVEQPAPLPAGLALGVLD
jgi:predicted dehydrogenase